MNEQKQEHYLHSIVRDFAYNCITGEYTELIDGTLAFICPHCGDITFVEHIYNKHSYKDSNNGCIRTQYAVTCGLCGKEFTTYDEYDPNIVNVIAELNHKGYTTEYCCEGHVYSGSQYQAPYIMFEYGSDIEKDYPDPPEGWYYDGKFSIIYNIPQECVDKINDWKYDESWKADAMESLSKWVSNIKPNQTTIKEK